MNSRPRPGREGERAPDLGGQRAPGARRIEVAEGGRPHQGHDAGGRKRELALEEGSAAGRFFGVRSPVARGAALHHIYDQQVVFGGKARLAEKGVQHPSGPPAEGDPGGVLGGARGLAHDEDRRLGVSPVHHDVGPAGREPAPPAAACRQPLPEGGVTRLPERGQSARGARRGSPVFAEDGAEGVAGLARRWPGRRPRRGSRASGSLRRRRRGGLRRAPPSTAPGFRRARARRTRSTWDASASGSRANGSTRLRSPSRRKRLTPTTTSRPSSMSAARHRPPPGCAPARNPIRWPPPRRRGGPPARSTRVPSASISSVERLDRPRTAERVRGRRDAALEGDHLLRAKRQLGGLFGGKAERLVQRVRVERLGPAEHGGERFERGADHIHAGLQSGQGRARRLRMEAQHLGPRTAGTEALPQQPSPEAAGGAELGDFLEEVRCALKKNETRVATAVHRQAALDRPPDIGEAVRQGETHFLRRRATGLPQVVAADAHRLETRQFAAAPLDDIGGEAQGRPRRDRSRSPAPRIPSGCRSGRFRKSGRAAFPGGGRPPHKAPAGWRRWR